MEISWISAAEYSAEQVSRGFLFPAFCAENGECMHLICPLNVSHLDTIVALI